MRNATACITTDGRSTIDNEVVISYMAVSPGCSLYLEVVQTYQQRRDQGLIATDVECVQDVQGNGIGRRGGGKHEHRQEGMRNSQTNNPSRSFQLWTSHGLHPLSRIFFVRIPRIPAAPNRRIQSTTSKKIC